MPPMFDAASLASPAVTINSDGSLTLHGDCQEEFSSLFQYDIGPWTEIDNTHLVIGQYENLADEMHWTHWSRSMMPPPPGQVLVREPSFDAMDEVLDLLGLLEPENTQPVASSSYLAPPPRPPPIRHASLTNVLSESMDALELEDVEEEESSMEMEDIDMDSELEPDDAASSSSSSLDKGKGKERARD